MDQNQLLALYHHMWTARQVDQVEQGIVHRGEAFFHVSGAGHEGSAVLAFHLTAEDWLFCHYRDKALALARGMTPRELFDGLLCKDSSSSRGRQMSAHLSSRELKLVSMPGPVGNSALQAAGVAQTLKRPDAAEGAVVLCCVGEGTTQEGEFLEACAAAARDELPVLFFVEDNHWAISTQTQNQTFYDTPLGRADTFHGIPIHRVDGRDVLQTDEQLGEIIERMRDDRRPAIVVWDVERLTSHTNADDQTIYRTAEDISESRNSGDPIARLEKTLLEQGVTTEQLQAIREEVERRVVVAETEAFEGDDPAAVLTAKEPLLMELTHPSQEQRGDDSVSDGLPMKDAMRQLLHHHLQQNEQVVLYGEDIEDPKGDVFGVTKGLSTAFPERVKNSPLSESTILGTAIGQALAGRRPVAFLQFADFLPLAYNQIATELGSYYWRTDGEWKAPVLVMIPCGGYRPGLGPFHSHSMESIAAHVPGVDVFMPSSAADAAGLLNAAFASPRPTLFFYPKSLLNDPTQVTSHDVDSQFVPIGVARKVRVGRDITFVGWGNTVRLCREAAEALEQVDVEAEVIDLRTISPWDEHAVLSSAEKTARLVVVHEDNQSCGVGAEVLATIAEKARVPVAMRRVTRPDTFIPCNFTNQLEVLPSFRRVLTTAAELLDLELDWLDAPQDEEEGIARIEAIGSGPSDETVTVVEMQIKPGQEVTRGDVVASLEATKSVFDLTSNTTGIVEEILVQDGETVAVGAPLARVKTTGKQARKAPTAEQNAKPVLKRKRSRETLIIPRTELKRRPFEVGMSRVATVAGSRCVTNEELVGHRTDGLTSEDILRRTGIEKRFWTQDGETAINMAVRACWKLLEHENLIVDDLDLVICSTTSPSSVTPSMACQILNGVTRGKTDAMLQAYDINAACSGYLYALQSGYDYLQSTPHGRVLIVTAEVLSPLLDPDDFDTAILFGDATSATVLYGEQHLDRALVKMSRPELSAKSEDGSSLSVPLPHDGYIQMKGRRVFTEAVRTMVNSLNRACDEQGISVDQLKMVVPHQANQRILDAIQNRIPVDVFSNIRHHGNTSSTSIPLCLEEVLPTIKSSDRIGLCAFGGGFTFGAGILQSVGV